LSFEEDGNGEYYFKGLSGLVRLNLARNSVKKIPANLFKHLESLENLNIDRNFIENFDDNTFNGLKSSLRNISLQYTKFNANCFKSLANFKKLECVKLGFNEIAFLNWPDLHAISNNLTHIDFQSNQITDFQVDETDTDQHQFLNGLVELELSNNKLCTFNKALFGKMKSLKSLSLTQNPLHCDCHLLELYEWTKRTYDKDLIQFVQWKCENFKNKKFVSLNQNDLKCDSKSKCRDSTPSTTTIAKTPLTTTSQIKTMRQTSTINDFYVTSYDNNLYVKWIFDDSFVQSINGFRIYIAEDAQNQSEAKTFTISDVKQRDFLIRNLNFNKKYVICLSILNGFNKYCKNYVIVKHTLNDTTQKSKLATTQNINSILLTIIISVLVSFLLFFIFFVYMFMYKCSNGSSKKSSSSTNTSMVSSTLSSLKNNSTAQTADIYNTLHQQNHPVHLKTIETAGDQHVYCEIPGYYFYPHQFYNNFNSALLVINPSTTSSSSLMAPQNQFTVSSTSII
jgi:hypothetical protein